MGRCGVCRARVLPFPREREFSARASCINRDGREGGVLGMELRAWWTAKPSVGSTGSLVPFWSNKPLDRVPIFGRILGVQEGEGYGLT